VRSTSRERLTCDDEVPGGTPTSPSRPPGRVGRILLPKAFLLNVQGVLFTGDGPYEAQQLVKLLNATLAYLLVLVGAPHVTPPAAGFAPRAPDPGSRRDR
jgi:hypothetical protein